MSARQRRRRTPIPAKVVAQVLFESDDTCCKCCTPGRRVQIHHIDGNPTNHATENLAVLCLECHDRAEIRGGVGRRLSAATIRTYRADWLARVAARRATVPPKSGVPPVGRSRGSTVVAPSDTVDALGALEVRQIGYAAEDAVPDWDRVAVAIRDLGRYARDFRDATRVEVLCVAHALASSARQGMTSRVAWMLHGAATEAMPLVVFRKPVSWAVEGPEHLRMSLGVELGRDLIYDGARYLKDFGVVKAGSALLGHALAMTATCTTPEVRADVEEAFDERIAAAREHHEDDVARWLLWERAEARERGSGDFESVKDLFDRK